jgi:hypothetical protein
MRHINEAAKIMRHAVPELSVILVPPVSPAKVGIHAGCLSVYFEDLAGTFHFSDYINLKGTAFYTFAALDT